MDIYFVILGLKLSFVMFWLLNFGEIYVGECMKYFSWVFGIFWSWGMI